MKKKFFLLSIVSIFTISGCKFLDDFFGINKKEEPIEEQQNNDDQSGDQGEKDQGKDGENEYEEGKKIDFKQVGEFYGGVVENEKYTGYEFSKSQDEIKKPTSGFGEINVFAMNDFHGAVLETDDEAGLRKIGTFYKVKSQQENTLILDQGDTWQGSFESNYQYGAIVQDVFNYGGVSLRTVGNHDFDWGLSHLEETTNRKIGDDYIPTLASNVYDYSDGKNGTTQQSRYGKEYATFTLDNGIKVGVVGVIGKNQITSISSQFVSTVCFTDHIEKAMEMCDYLRSKKACDVVIVSSHESTGDICYLGLDNLSPVTNHRYADLVLGGHAHYRQEQTIGGVKYVQWDGYGESTGSVKLKYDFSKNELVDSETQVKTYNPSNYSTHYSQIDPTIEKMINDYLEISNPISAQVLSENFSYFDTRSFSYLMCEAINDAVTSAGYTVDFSVCNYARKYFAGSTITYGDLYKSFPFDNQVILMDVSGYNAYNSLYSNMTYRANIDKAASAYGTFKIAVIDYIGLHQNTNREYDYFPNATNSMVFNPDPNNEPPTYREILKDYILKDPTRVFDSSVYTSNNPHFALD